MSRILPDAELREKINQQVIKLFMELGKTDPIMKGTTLSPQQMSLLFDVNLVPQDPAHQRCVFCGHFSTNTCRENAEMDMRNVAKDNRYKEKMAVCDDHQAACDLSKSWNEDPPPKPNDPHSVSDPPKKLTQKPIKLIRKDIESPMVQCMCSTSYCVQVGTDIGSLCFSKCRVTSPASHQHPCNVDLDADRYPWVGSSRKMCSCPI